MKTTFARLQIAGAILALAGCAATAPPPLVQGEAAREQVFATERAFAKSMADRDLDAFARLVSEDTVFFSGPKPLHGKQAVVDFWSKFYKAGTKPPFAWEPEVVEVLKSGALARSTGPVHDLDGKLIGCFNSIWRQESRGQWKIVFDHGMSTEDCEKKK
jgi:ketosteroid isomerase-like protein